MSKKKIFVVSVVSILLFASCGIFSKKTDNKDKMAVKKVIENVKKRKLDYNWIKARTKLNAEGYNATATIKMKSKKLIWISVSAFFMEVGRVKITPEQILFIDKFHKKYGEYSYDYANKYLATQNLNFESLENMILGYPIFPLDNKYTISEEEKGFNLSYQTNSFEEKLAIGIKNFKVISHLLRRTANKQELFIKYNEYQQIDNKSVPRDVSIKALTPSEKNIKIRFVRFEFKDDEQAPFSIPSNYKKM